LAYTYLQSIEKSYFHIFMKKIILPLVVFVIIIRSVTAQSTRYGLKLGPTAATQRWNYWNNGPLYKLHGDLWMESYSDEDPYSIFAQLGYHNRGSATRYRTPIVFQSKTYTVPADEFIFRNLSAVVGFKKKFIKQKMSSYYSIGLRGEYTMSTNLGVYTQLNEIVGPVYPFKEGVKKAVMGVTFGAGLDFPFSEYIGGILELNIAPDITKQYFQPAIPNVINFYQPGQTTTIEQKSIKNFSLELSFGIHFLKKVVYVD